MVRSVYPGQAVTHIEKFQLFVAVPIVIVLALVEGWVLTRSEQYDWRACAVSVLDVVMRVAVNILVPLSLAGPFLRLAYDHRLTTLPLDNWSAFLLLFFGQELSYYWYHRTSHRVRWFWANHSVHHSSNQLNLSAAFRIGILGRMTGTLLFFVPLVWLGFEVKVVTAVLALNLLYQFWLHTTWIPKLGWLEGILNTPSAHRVHHAANLDYLDANYGGVLLIFDRLFGTYTPERADLPCRYGLVDPLTSYNPLRIQFGRWLSLARDLLAARSLRAFFGYLVMPPGWSPCGEGNTTAELRARHEAAVTGVEERAVREQTRVLSKAAAG
jgi:sterol desaturase/sphingolipid hydroxylase (fatty acid hydroxylase superfamily)